MAKNEAIGHIQCDSCNGDAEVCQTKRGAGRYLYTRCNDCGTDQRSGAAVQTRLWSATNWVSGEPDVRPPNVPELLGSEPEIDTAGAESEPIESDSGGSGFVWFGGFALAVIAVLLGRSPR